jgi:mRNA-degrading endonuclease RelE of RelBE toxin-antitoxin system
MANEEYSLELSSAAKKRLRRHKHAEAQILRALMVLRTDPLAGHELTGKLQGLRSLKFSVKGSGEYRAIYEIFPETASVWIHWIGTRENIYEEAERHMFG